VENSIGYFIADIIERFGKPGLDKLKVIAKEKWKNRSHRTG
jgi:hypothetical protein